MTTLQTNININVLEQQIDKSINDFASALKLEMAEEIKRNILPINNWSYYSEKWLSGITKLCKIKKESIKETDNKFVSSILHNSIEDIVDVISSTYNIRETYNTYLIKYMPTEYNYSDFKEISTIKNYDEKDIPITQWIKNYNRMAADRDSEFFLLKNEKIIIAFAYTLKCKHQKKDGILSVQCIVTNLGNNMTLINFHGNDINKNFHYKDDTTTRAPLPKSAIPFINDVLLGLCTDNAENWSFITNFSMIPSEFHSLFDKILPAIIKTAFGEDIIGDLSARTRLSHLQDKFLEEKL